MRPKKIKKLSLTKETIASLDNKDLKKVQGGYTVDQCLTRDLILSCRIICTFDCP